MLLYFVVRNPTKKAHNIIPNCIVNLIFSSVSCRYFLLTIKFFKDIKTTNTVKGKKNFRFFKQITISVSILNRDWWNRNNIVEE